MAINKRKVLDGARKHAQKGAKQKALKEYNKLVQADPRDAKLLLEIGDVYRRWGQAEEAVAQYTKVANQYKQDGFDARAVAVLKQILNLDPKRYTAHVSLAELYQRMGLDSDAVAALRTAADGYYREGRRKEALELLRKMAALDPANTTSRLKVADLLHQEAMDDDAVAEYRAIVDELKRQGANEQVCVVQERILELRDDDVDTLTALAQNLSDLGRPERAEPFAVRALAQAGEPAQFELLAGIYKSLGNDVKLVEVTRKLAAYYKGRGDDDNAREVLQRLPPESVMDGPALGDDRSDLDRSEVDDAEIGDDELLDDEEFLVTDATDQSEAQTLIHDSSTSADELVGMGVSEDDLPEGDPEQLFAEASVYLRYGKRVQAIASLRSALRQEPDHRGVLEKLGEAYAEEGRDDDAIGCWQQAAEIARADIDVESFTVLRDRIGALDAQAAAEMEPMAEQAGAGVEVSEADAEDGADEVEDDLGFEIDVSETEGFSVDAADETVLGDASDDEFEIDLDAEMGVEDDADASPSANEAAAALADDAVAVEDGEDLEGFAFDDAPGLDVDVDLDDGAEDAPPAVVSSEEDEIEIDFDDAADDLGVAVDHAVEADEASAQTSSEYGQSTTTAAQVREDLEEAEFYLQQGLEGEAEGLYQRILEVAPNHPTALLKLGELVAQRGEDPGAVTDPGFAAQPDETVDPTDDGVDDALVAEDDVEVEAASSDLDEDASVDDDLVDALACDTDDDEAAGDAAASDSDQEEADGWSPPELSDDLAAVLAEAEAAVDAASESQEMEVAVAAPADEETERQLAVGVDPAIGDQLGDDATEVEAVGLVNEAGADTHFLAEPVQAEPDPSRAFADDTMPMADSTPSAPGDALAESSRTVGGGDEATFDLAAELADVFEDANAVESAEPAEARAESTVEDGFESLFADFKKGVSATLDDGDYDTRFDLGIAYREMGLFDDAIGEFTACLGSADRKFESLHMMALCAMELDRHADAVSHLEQALATGDLPDARIAALQFDLGRAHGRAGDAAAARRALETVERIDPGFPGLGDEIARLDQTGSSEDGPVELDTPSEEFESFTDLMGDDDDEPGFEAEAEPEPETFESFDDVIADAEAADSVAELADAAEVGDEPLTLSDPIVEADDQPEPERPAAGRKKKKISFV